MEICASELNPAALFHSIDGDMRRDPLLARRLRAIRRFGGVGLVM